MVNPRDIAGNAEEEEEENPIYTKEVNIVLHTPRNQDLSYTNKKCPSCTREIDCPVYTRRVKTVLSKTGKWLQDNLQ